MNTRKMKSSGIKWVGDIPENWNVHPLYCYFGERKNKNSLLEEKNLLSLSYGKIIRKDINTNGGLLPENFSSYNIVENNDIVIRPTDLQNDKRSLRTGLVKEHGIITSAYITLKPKDNNVDTRYYHYLLHSYDVIKVFYNMGNGVRQGLNYSEFSNLMVLGPSYQEQKCIADFLDVICNEIDEINSIIEKQISILEEYKISRIDEIIERYKNRYTSINTKLARVSNLITKQTGFDYSSYIKPSLLNEPSEDTYPYIQTKDFKYNYFNYDTDFYIPQKIAHRFPKILKNSPCVLMSLSGSIGNVGVFSALKDAFIGAAICIIDLEDIELCDYVKYLLLSSSIQNYLAINIFTSAHSNITVQNIRNIPIVIFEKSIMIEMTKEFNDSIVEIDMVIEEKKNQIESLKNYKKSIIYEYVTGKKEV